ncbi:MAG TPA: PepSY-associated TM helix domain-containing protein [Candidatus Sulfotelmatobacter sp.]|nr:PepSY-associated TM helix domain-containing protein [Candidatus Sulfotelmatobacter sp.]
MNRAPSKASKRGATPITPDEAVAAALLQMPGAVPYRVQMPAFGGTYQVAMLDSRDKISGDRNVVALDPFGNVVFVTRSRDLSRGERILAINEAIHTGNISGIPSRIAVCLASAMVLVQAASGLLMWLYRNRFLARQSTEQGYS